METIILIITIIGGIAGVYTILDYKKNHVDKPNEEKEHLKIQFLATQTLSKNVRKSLTEYAEKYNAHDEIIFSGTTISIYLKMLEDSQHNNLSDKILNDVMTLELSSSNIQSMTKSLESQFNALLEIEGWIKLKQIQC